ncbi:MAG: ThiF family adenylyltransferase, partial [Niabella sp.]|nr:ThiF family adenylyltransferase [Niabella sp.]
YPCFIDGTRIMALWLNDNAQEMVKGITVNYSFSNNPGRAYIDYYEKISTYANIISAPAKAIDNNVTEKSFPTFEEDAEGSVFMYEDTNSGRANITSVSEKLKGQRIAIIGTGGTGSYILDFVAKTPVQEIHLFDSDSFYVHNAFRTPGAASLEDLDRQLKKVEYLHEKYSKMHKGIVPNDVKIVSDTLPKLMAMSFVFIAIDKGEVKKVIIEFLLKEGIPFIDVGLGLEVKNNSLIGSVRTTTGTPEKNDHLNKYISFVDEEDDGYNSNIQIAELNALNACFAVIKWKKLFGFYNDMEKEFNTVYVVNESQLVNNEICS